LQNGIEQTSGERESTIFDRITSGTQEEDDPPSEDTMELHCRDPDLHLGRGMLAQLSLETDALMAPSPIETDPVMRAGYQFGGSYSSPRLPSLRKPKPKIVTDPKVNLSAILQCEGLSKEEADQFSSSSDPDDDNDSTFEAFMDPFDAGSEAGGGEENNEPQETENGVDDQIPADVGDGNTGSGEAGDDAAGVPSGGGDSAGGGGSNGSDDDEAGNGNQDGKTGDDDDEEEEVDEDDDAAEESTPRKSLRIRLRMEEKNSPKDAAPPKRKRKKKPGQCILLRHFVCSFVTLPGVAPLLRNQVLYPLLRSQVWLISVVKSHVHIVFSL